MAKRERDQMSKNSKSGWSIEREREEREEICLK